ncbi:MAG TPA: WD40 repeat domain-containing serine/threonine protein kinase [Polyangia bacterium]|nr:WD40 repeat domain-containing serine/threonine protein kinase [Polyangia bacterium]
MAETLPATSPSDLASDLATGDTGIQMSPALAGTMPALSPGDLATEDTMAGAAAGVALGGAATAPGSRHALAPRSGPARTEHLRPLERSSYHTEREIGRGGMGRVIVAVDQRFGRRVALKEMLPAMSHDAALEQRFLEEALITGALEHRSIVPVYDIGQGGDGVPYYTMRLVEGRSLREVLRETASLPERLALIPRLTDIAEALAHAHSQGVIHRDIKPDNIVLGAHGDTFLIDWGIARVRGRADLRGQELAARIGRLRAPGDTGTLVGQIIGTPAYMSPEQAAGGELDERSDVYSLGVLLYEVCTGIPAYGGTSSALVLDSVLGGPPPPLLALEPHAPADLAAVIGKAMARLPEERYASAQELAGDLRRYVSGQRVTAYRYSLGQRGARFVRRQWQAVAAVAAVLCACVVVTGWGMSRLVAARDTALAAAERAEQGRLAALDRLALERAEAALVRDPWGTLAHLAALSDRAPSGEAWLLASIATDRGGIRLVGQGGAPPQGPLPEERTLEVRDGDGFLPGGAAAVTWLGFAPGAKALVLATGSMVRWHPLDRSGARPMSLACSGGRPEDVSFVAGGSTVVFRCGTTALRWDVAQGTHSRQELPEGVVRMSTSSDGRMLALALGRDGCFALGPWGTDSHLTPTRCIKADSVLDDIVFAPGDKRLVVAGGLPKPTFYEVPSGRPYYGRATPPDVPEFAIQHLRRTPDGRAVVGFGSKSRLLVLDPESGGGRPLLIKDSSIEDVAFTAEGQRVVTGGADGALRVWELSSGRLLDEWKALTQPIHHVALGDGIAATSDAEGDVVLWDLERGRWRLVERGIAQGPLALSLSAAGGYLAYALPGGRVRLMELPPRDLGALRRAIGLALEAKLKELPDP